MIPDPGNVTLLTDDDQLRNLSYVGIGGPFRGDLMGRLENNFR